MAPESSSKPPSSSGTRLGRDGGALGLLRAAALISAVVGAVGSFASMFWVGHRNPSLVLMALFTIWVLSPFVALLWVRRVAKRWPPVAQATVHGATLILTLSSFAIYADVAISAPKATPARLFLLVPLASWVLMTTGGLIAGRFGLLTDAPAPGASSKLSP